MLASQTLAHIRQLAVVTKRLMDGPLTGDMASAHRGYGVELDQLREYQFGDDIRFIDFKSSCRLGKTMVKECLEERNRRIILAVDISSSVAYGSQGERFTTVQDAAAILAFAAHYARDSIGLILFSHELECVIEPANTQRNFHQIVQRLYTCAPRERVTTAIETVLTHIATRWHKDAIVFIISDFIIDEHEREFRAAAACADVVAVRCYDPAERLLPFDGYILAEDSEHGTHVSLKAQQNQLVLNDRLHRQDAIFGRCGIDVLDITYNQDICRQLIEFFRRRMRVVSLRAW